MHEEGKNILVQLRKKWMYKTLLSQFFLALGLTIIISTVLYKLFSLPLYAALPCLGILFGVISIVNRSWKMSEYDVSRFLNISRPSLEESAHLVLKSPSALNLLEKLQVRKVESELLSLKAQDPFKKRFTISLLVLLIASAVSLALFKIPYNLSSSSQTNSTKRSSVNTIPETILPEIKKATITISPPAYTGKGSRQQSRFNLLAEEGAVVSWQIQTNVAAKQVALIFNDGSILQLSGDEKRSSWRTQKQIRSSGFYQVKIDKDISDLYQIESVKDQRPTIVIQTPKPNTYINYGQSVKVSVAAHLSDDYGISTANISATISSGQGEAVKFKEQKLSFENFSAGRRQTHLLRTIDCKALGMQPGDELYFFISAVDNHKQETRSEVYIITLQDTADMTGIDGLVTPIDVKTELFRSQRQIIIETEQLLKDKSKLSAEAFTTKSNNLGIDQKLLRMRYGKFLGEETNVEIGEAHEEDQHGEHSEDNAESIIEQYSHIHDRAEDATFFDAATKKQLRETLTEMWNAEVKLRTILPKEALPFEYKALKLLKDLQQKSRAYVPKTGSKTTPIKLDKRLTGDLTKISQPLTKQTLKKPEAAGIILRKALGTLEELKANGILSVSAKGALQQAFQQLSVRAANQPAIYLTSLSALRKILNENFRVKDIDNAAQGLQKMIAAADRLPGSNTNAAMELSKRYFINLTKASR